jgi:organic radical activating enzyme
MGDRLYRPALEINVVDHCNLRCANCDHFSHLAPTKFADLAQVERDLAALAAAVTLRELQFLGGEPLLHPQLLELLEIGRRSKIAQQLVLVTNGVLLHKADPSLFKLIDGMWISRYPGVSTSYDEEWLRDIATENGVWVWLKDTDTFTQKQLNQPNEDEDLVRHIYFSCLEAHIYSCHTIHEGRYYKCPPSLYMSTRLRMKGYELDNRVQDSVPLHDNPNLRADLERFIASDRPLEACRWCLGSIGPLSPHRQLNRAGIRLELDESHPAPRSLIRPEFIVPSTQSREGRSSRLV